ncbi:hypothetical protein JQN58_12725 [Aneurinibacillus sp. BA2021]|nr:hypothetical protein [Aneurinibacillus sp. BA2021]
MENKYKNVQIFIDDHLFYDGTINDSYLLDGSPDRYLRGLNKLKCQDGEKKHVKVVSNDEVLFNDSIVIDNLKMKNRVLILGPLYLFNVYVNNVYRKNDTCGRAIEFFIEKPITSLQQLINGRGSLYLEDGGYREGTFKNGFLDGERCTARDTFNKKDIARYQVFLKDEINLRTGEDYQKFDNLFDEIMYQYTGDFKDGAFHSKNGQFYLYRGDYLLCKFEGNFNCENWIIGQNTMFYDTSRGISYNQNGTLNYLSHFEGNFSFLQGYSEYKMENISYNLEILYESNQATIKVLGANSEKVKMYKNGECINEIKLKNGWSGIPDNIQF